MNKFDLKSFYSLKNKTEKEYKKIKQLYNPALKSNIIFNVDGFHHLRYDGSRSERSKRVQKNKFTHFKRAVKILEVSTTVQEYRRSICPIGKKDKKGFRATKIVEWFAFFSVVSFTNHIRIKIVVRRIGGDNGQFHFWSVMPFWNLSNERKIIGSNNIIDE